MTNPVPADVHALVGAYAIDALDPAETQDFERHLAECAECRREVDTLREAATALAATSMLLPPAALRARVLEGLGGVEQLPPPAGVQAPTSAPTPTHRADGPADPPARDERDVVVLPRRKMRVAALAVAAATVAAIGLGSVVVDSFQDDPPPTVAPTLEQRLLAADDAEKVSVEFPGGARATVVRSVELGRAMIVTENMPAPPSGKVYQLWFDDVERGMVSAGLMPVASDQTVLLQGAAARAEAVGITVEPAGGSTAPHSQPIALFDFEPAQV